MTDPGCVDNEESAFEHLASALNMTRYEDHVKVMMNPVLLVKVQGSGRESETEEVTSFLERMSAIDVPNSPGSPIDRSRRAQCLA